MVNPASDVAELVKKQLSNYFYIYPTLANVSTYYLLSIKVLIHKLCQPSPLNVVPYHMRPYRNPVIIAVIWELHFTGGNTCFAQHFKQYVLFCCFLHVYH
jgi:hypothetical protein